MKILLIATLLILPSYTVLSDQEFRFGIYSETFAAYTRTLVGK